MTIDEFEKKIKKEIDPRLNIHKNLGTSDMAGVYLDNAYLGVALPQKEILERSSQFYIAKDGVPYRGIEEAERDIKAKLKTMDKEKYELLTND